MNSALECHLVTKRFASSDLGIFERAFGWVCRRLPDTTTVVDRVSFRVGEGEIFGILGPNGSGKSTLIRIIATLLLPDEGLVRVFGHDVTVDLSEVRSLIGRVSVDAALFKKLSPIENLLFSARLYGLPGDEAWRRTTEVLEQVGFSDKEMRMPIEEFSRGMQQKVCIARAFLTEPRLLLLDEPTTGLDPKSRLDVQAMILRFRDHLGTTILLTTHDMAEADRLCDRVAILARGRFVAVDSPSGLKKSLPGACMERTLESVFLHLTGDALVEANAPPEEIAA